MDGPKSIRKHPLRQEILRAQRAAINEVLIYRAEHLHRTPNADRGIIPSRLAASRFVSHLYDQGGSTLLLCVWVWVNDSYKARVSLRADLEEGSGRLEWHRCSWPLRGHPRASG